MGQIYHGNATMTAAVLSEQYKIVKKAWWRYLSTVGSR